MNKSLLCSLISALSLSALAQSVPNAGSISREVDSAEFSPPPARLAVPDAPQVSPSATAAADSAPFLVREIRIEGAQALPAADLRALVAPSEGRQLSLGDLRALADRISARYAAAGLPLARAFVPPQSVENGVVVIRVLEGKLGAVKLENASRLADAQVRRYLANAAPIGAPLQQARSERALLLLKDLPGTREVSYRLEPDENGGDTALVASLDKAPLFTGSVSAENYGSKSTGRLRTRVGIDVNSPFGFGEKFSVQGMSSFKGVDFLSLGADVPVGADGLIVGANVSHTRYDLGGSFRALDAHGNANKAELSARYPLLRSNDKNLWLTGGVEYRGLRDVVGATKTATRKELGAVNLGLNGSFQDSLLAGGQTRFSFSNTFGDLRFKNADAKAIDAASVKTAGNYYKLNVSAGHTRYFSPQWSASANVSAQWANKNLDSAEQFSLGGPYAVAAYHSNDVSADHGIIGQLDVRYAVNPYVSLSAFYDAGWAKLRHKPFGDGRNSISLHGGGFGIATYYKGFNLQSKVAWRGSKDRFSDDRSPQWWLNFGYSFER